MAKMVQISEDVLEKAWKLLILLKQEENTNAKRAAIGGNYERVNKCLVIAQQTEAVLEDIEAALDAKE